MTITTSAWALALMLSFSNPERLASLPGSAETGPERRARYALVAEDAAAVAFDPAEAPLFAGGDGRYHTLALELAVAFHEGGYRKDVDVGPRCAKGSCDEDKRGLQHATCLMQVEVGEQGNKTVEGWTRADLFADRKKCFRAGLHLLRAAMGKCRAGEYLNAYASGKCLLETEQSRTLRDDVDHFWGKGKMTLAAGRKGGKAGPLLPAPAGAPKDEPRPLEGVLGGG